MPHGQLETVPLPWGRVRALRGLVQILPDPPEPSGHPGDGRGDQRDGVGVGSADALAGLAIRGAGEAVQAATMGAVARAAPRKDIDMAQPAQVQWGTCENDRWCDLWKVRLKNPKLVGVYIIWRVAPKPLMQLKQVVYVGQGVVQDRIEEHREDFDILTELVEHDAYVTWAALRPSALNGVERYLANLLKPLVGVRHPAAEPIPVSLPW